ncbi:acid phosphatase 1 [Malania oleifera]|uniref:acid phosphatase 1 n=1 Tax=Malania oleifera TaxID=397392 RepID=UPI0025AEA63C|nr:acid phosphatase 1 [Malania oleifera]
MFFVVAGIATGGAAMTTAVGGGGSRFCLSWRLAVETNNVRAWRTVPTQCIGCVGAYMLGGQYRSDLQFLVEQILSYVTGGGVVVSGDGMDAWTFDIDETCLSNLPYYTIKRYGGDPYDPVAFFAWASKGLCPAIPEVLGLFNKLIKVGFKVFFLTGRDEATLRQPTVRNLQLQGFIGYKSLIMRTAAYKGQSAVTFKSAIRKELVAQGYRIWGNVGDQWSDLQGDCPGNRTFKVPNPMYFVP